MLIKQKNGGSNTDLSAETNGLAAKPERAMVNTISKSLESTLQPVEIYQYYNQQLGLKNTLLLESAEVESRDNVKSILMLQAAVRIECNANRVELRSLTANGRNALAQISQQLLLSAQQSQSKNAKNVIQCEPSGNDLTIVTLTSQSNFVDEDSRLKQVSVIDVLRVVKNSFISTSNNEYSIFLGGLFGYDLVASFEELPAVSSSANDCPDYLFYLAENLLVIDHQKNQKRLFCNHFPGDSQQKTYFELSRSIEKIDAELEKISRLVKSKQVPDPAMKKNDSVHKDSNNEGANEIQVDFSDADYQQIVEDLKQNIGQGDVFQVVPSRRFSLACNSPIESYIELKRSNPSPYMFFMQDERFCLFGASPESALKYTQKTNQVELYPIAGTRPRGQKIVAVGQSKVQSDNLQDDHFSTIDLDLDARIEAELKLDQKEVSEHMMLVDLARNDIARIATPGSIRIPRLLEVDRYSQVMHLVSCVQGQLRQDLDALHAYQACMNMGTLTGAPKIKATQLIRNIEGRRRGAYGGAVGYLNGDGDMDTCIVIRSAFYQNGIAYVQAGAGIVFDSIAAMESQETENKAKAVINAIIKANQKNLKITVNTEFSE